VASFSTPSATHVAKAPRGGAFSWLRGGSPGWGRISRDNAFGNWGRFRPQLAPSPEASSWASTTTRTAASTSCAGRTTAAVGAGGSRARQKPSPLPRRSGPTSWPAAVNRNRTRARRGRPSCVQARGPRARDGIYPYETNAGTRWPFAFRQSDGQLSTRRGFTSRGAAAMARRRLVEAIERGEVRVARQIDTGEYVSVGHGASLGPRCEG
jgi:hypothetical protein